MKHGFLPAAHPVAAASCSDTYGCNNLSCVRFPFDRMRVICQEELHRWHVTFRGRKSQKPPILEMLVLHHFKPLIGCEGISGRPDSAIISAYINKQHFIHPALEACREPVTSGCRRISASCGQFVHLRAAESLIACLGVQP